MNRIGRKLNRISFCLHENKSFGDAMRHQGQRAFQAAMEWLDLF
jgi:hypothetical protein